jgi:hypothetical protein
MEPSKIDFKTYGFIKELVTKGYFRNQIKRIRINNNIPVRGFSISKYDEFIIKEKYPRIPNKINKIGLFADLNNLLYNYNLSSGWIDFFTDYILFNWFGDYLDSRQIITLDLGPKTNTKEINEKIIDNSKIFGLNPVAILIPPFLTQRELADYLEVNFEEIERFQKKYRNNSFKISKRKQHKSNNNVRDNYIYKHRGIKKKELASKVAQKFGQILDYTHINKIIKEQERRKSAGI